jgi:hypothetical protein
MVAEIWTETQIIVQKNSDRVSGAHIKVLYRPRKFRYCLALKKRLTVQLRSQDCVWHLKIETPYRPAESRCDVWHLTWSSYGSTKSLYCVWHLRKALYRPAKSVYCVWHLNKNVLMYCVWHLTKTILRSAKSRYCASHWTQNRIIPECLDTESGSSDIRLYRPSVSSYCVWQLTKRRIVLVCLDIECGA